MRKTYRKVFRKRTKRIKRFKSKKTKRKSSKNRRYKSHSLNRKRITRGGDRIEVAAKAAYETFLIRKAAQREVLADLRQLEQAEGLNQKWDPTSLYASLLSEVARSSENPLAEDRPGSTWMSAPIQDLIHEKTSAKAAEGLWATLAASRRSVDPTSDVDAFEVAVRVMRNSQGQRHVDANVIINRARDQFNDLLESYRAERSRQSATLSDEHRAADEHRQQVHAQLEALRAAAPRG